MPELNTVTDPNLPEPKGISTANADEVYAADGAGSGDWKILHTQGWEDVNDSGSSQSLTSGSWVSLTNDAAGPNTATGYLLPGYSTGWDTTNNEFDWSGAGLEIGDTVDIRFDVSITTTTANDYAALKLVMAYGDPDEFDILICGDSFKTAGTTQRVLVTSLYIGSTAVLNNPAKVQMYTDGSGNSVVVTGWYVRYVPQHAVLA